MLITRRTRLRQRRGVALILILGMLGLLALIGVTFATFTGQARVGARNYAQSVLRPQSGELMDFALSQLIGDTNDVRSAIRGHSLARDMYGNDAANNGYVDYNPANTVNGQLQFTAATLGGDGTILATTNIPIGIPAFYGYDFTRWVVKFESAPGSVSGGIETRLIGQTFEVLVDDVSAGAGNPRVFHLTPPAATSAMGLRDGYASPDVHPIAAEAGATEVGESGLIGEVAHALDNTNPGVPLNVGFALDGRFLRAFNGPGMGYTSALDAPGSGNLAPFANMRYNGGILAGNNAIVMAGDPNALAVPSMDEDYDAADVENWFLALQSADGKVIIPSFHRPGILERANWSDTSAISRSKILRPRKKDGHSAQSFPDLTPSKSTGRIEFDVDNDGDGLTDSVWVDLGYPAVKDSRGMLYKPMFAFMVVGLNGRIPLNTAGNLQMRNTGGGGQRHMHTSRLGTSPSEVDPTFGLQNSPPVVIGIDGSGNPVYDTSTVHPQYDNAIDEDSAGATFQAGVGVNVTQLRNILTGTRPDPDGLYADNNLLGFTDPSTNTFVPMLPAYYLPNNLYDGGDTAGKTQLAPRAVAGRWGEAGLIPPYFDLTSTPPPSFMWFPNVVRAGVSTPTLNSPAADGRDGLHVAFDYYPTPSTGETADYYDAAGDFALPVERSRRFVTPYDLYGDGRIGQFDDSNKVGADEWGRVAFDKYFRPPGIPLPTVTLSPTDTANFPTTIAGDFADPTNVIDVTTNPLHGFESYRNTQAGADRKEAARRYGATPTNLDDAGNPVEEDDGSGTMVPIVTSGGKAIPTYNSIINSMRMGRGISGADEMNLYRPSPNDDPFGYQDLEWLYRAQDREGPSLFSRLAELAPVSFRDSVDAQRRRRLYSIDAWESNAIVWTNDNPHNKFSDNSRFSVNQNASLAVLHAGGAPFVAAAGSNVGQSAAPSLAHRGRKINLNYPLPVSNDPDEPTRRKWITESYQLLKTMLPPLSLDTPEELAMLSQFLVNIIDFRDSDAAMTRFVNPDVYIRQNAGAPPTLILASDSTLDATKDLPLVQYGMEYNPIAINEVLAYEFQTKMGGAEQPVGRFFIELVNTLTKPRGSDASTINLGGFDFETNNPYGHGSWDLIFTSDAPDVRPDPFTGQLLPLPTGVTGHFAPLPLNRESFVENVDVAPRSMGKGGPPTTGDNYYFVIGNQLSVANGEVDPPSNINPSADKASQRLTIKPAFDPMGAAPAPTGLTLPAGVLPTADATPGNGTYPGRIPYLGGAGAPPQYKWVCLRRPANPFAPVDADNPMVVVDSMRFHFIEGTGPMTGGPDADNNPIPDPLGANRIYSTQRFQPYRGGHAVLNPTTGKLDYRYGYTEQTIPTAVSATGTVGQYSTDTSGTTHPATGKVYSTLGQKGGEGPPKEYDDAWDYFVFNDRDFVSPAELLLVPGCPPGLFTKQFVEWAPLYTAQFSAIPPLPAPTPSPSAPAPSLFGKRFSTAPRSYPYLVDRLFYTSASLELHRDPVTNTVPTWDPIRGPSAGGWHKMFGVFEVPSRAAGAVASAANGYNYDWFRQDTRPGQLNLNLIIDEEVFLGLMGNAGKRTPQPPATIPASVPDEYITEQQVRDVPPALNGTQLAFSLLDVDGATGLEIPSADAHGFNAGRGFAPLVVTEWEPGEPDSALGAPVFGFLGLPTALSTMQRAAYPVSNTGFLVHDASGMGMSNLKSAFVDFLKLRHGGSGYLFGPLPEAPFRSFSHPDINYTIMRPAFPTFNVGKTLPNSDGDPIVNYYVPADHGLVKRDAGVKNPDLTDPSAALILPPAIPPRRLFQLTDDTTEGDSNAGNAGEPVQLGYNTPANGRLQRSRGNLAASGDAGQLKKDAGKHGGMHPYWRSEWMQKMMNLGTVRTHQYAVWVTVGFFEVISQGDPAAAWTTANPDAAYDVIGREVGLIGGKNVRHRGFFIVDRLKLEGFDPNSPGKFREAVLYRRIIQ